MGVTPKERGMKFKGNDMLTMDERASYLKISKLTLYKRAADHRLPGMQSARRWRFHKDAVAARILHCLYHLAPHGTAGFVPANGPLTRNTSGKGELRKNLEALDYGE